MVVTLLLNYSDDFQHIQTFHYEKRRGPAVFGLMCRWQMFYTIFFSTLSVQYLLLIGQHRVRIWH